MALYLAHEWFLNSRIELASMALALAHLAAPGATPTLAFQQPPTPEEQQELLRKADKVARIWKIIYNDWVSGKRLRYTVRANEKVAGRPIKDIMHVKFWVGVDGKGSDLLDIDEAVAVFELLKDQTEQLRGIQNLKTPTLQAKVTVKRHDIAQIAAVLGGVKIDEPPSKKKRKGQ